MKKALSVLLMAVLIVGGATWLVGCGSSGNYAKEPVDPAAAAAAKASEDAAAAKFAEGWPKLQKGMTVGEVSELLGTSFGSLLPEQGRVTFPNGRSVAFENGRLAEWK